MFHTQGLKTSLIDSVYDRTNFRTEFRFQPDQIYLSNMRLLNLGVVASQLDTAQPYNYLVGSYGVVRQISLMDGNETLSNMVDFNRYSAFKSFTTKNDVSTSVQHFLQQNGLDYVYTDVDVFDASGNSIQYGKIEELFSAGNITTDEPTSSKGWLSLRDCVPFLSASQYVPTNIFRNLRLVVEYDTLNSSYANFAATTFTTNEPFLVADMMVNSKVANQLMMEYKGLSWVDVETDRMVLKPVELVLETNPNPVQSENFLVNGFNNKRVNRVVMVNVPTSLLTYKSDDDINAVGYTKFANMGSMGMLKQSVQVVLNGSNLFTEPIDTANKRLASVVDNYGDAVCPLGYGNYEGLTGLVDNSVETLNNTDYTVFSLGGARVQELVIQYQRTGQHEAGVSGSQTLRRYNQQLFLVLYAEVQKTMVVGNGGKYVIGYA